MSPVLFYHKFKRREYSRRFNIFKLIDHYTDAASKKSFKIKSGIMTRGDTKIQADLRDRMIKKETNMARTPYITKILSVFNQGMNLLDIGCGTGHIIQQLAVYENSFVVGLDISSAMLEKAAANTRESSVRLIEGDGLNLPFGDCTFDVVITRLAEYSLEEAHRVLKSGGYFFEYGLGPESNKEIVEFFPDRIDEEAFFFPKTDNWKKEVCEEIESAEFVVNSIEDYTEMEYYQSEEELTDLIEMVPLVRDFDRETDRKMIDELAKKYKKGNNIEITWHYHILEAQRL